MLITLPEKLGLPPDKLGLQVRCVYGARDAMAIWEDTSRAVLKSAGFKHGVPSHGIVCHAGRHPTCVIHGDDVTILGDDKTLDRFGMKHAKSYRNEWAIMPWLLWR